MSLSIGGSGHSSFQENPLNSLAQTFKEFKSLYFQVQAPEPKPGMRKWTGLTVVSVDRKDLAKNPEMAAQLFKMAIEGKVAVAGGQRANGTKEIRDSLVNTSINSRIRFLKPSDSLHSISRAQARAHGRPKLPDEWVKPDAVKPVNKETLESFASEGPPLMPSGKSEISETTPSASVDETLSSSDTDEEYSDLSETSSEESFVSSEEEPFIESDEALPAESMPESAETNEYSTTPRQSKDLTPKTIAIAAGALPRPPISPVEASEEDGEVFHEAVEHQGREVHEGDVYFDAEDFYIDDDADSEFINVGEFERVGEEDFKNRYIVPLLLSSKPIESESTGLVDDDDELLEHRDLEKNKDHSIDPSSPSALLQQEQLRRFRQKATAENTQSLMLQFLEVWKMRLARIEKQAQSHEQESKRVGEKRNIEETRQAWTKETETKKVDRSLANKAASKRQKYNEGENPVGSQPG